MNRTEKPHSFFSKEEEQEIVAKIKEVESASSAEIRIHLSQDHKGEILDEAQKKFEQLGMTQTKDRNGVLIYLSLKKHQFVVLGDHGIYEKVPADFWNETIELMKNDFKQDRFSLGIVKAVEKVGVVLKKYFPITVQDQNELSDGISY